MARGRDWLPLVLMLVAMKCTVFCGGSFFQVLSNPRPNFEQLSAAERMPTGGFGSIMPMAGLAAAGLAITVRAGLVRRRSRTPRGPDPDKAPILYDSGVVPFPCREKPVMDENMAEWWKQKVSGLAERLPITDEEFMQQARDEMYLKWRPAMRRKDNKARGMAVTERINARSCLNMIRRAPETFKRLRYFKPLALKYPTLLRREKVATGYDHWDVDPLEIENNEAVAGFTYEDFLSATNDNTFVDWAQPQEGDIIPGTVMKVDKKRGAFVDIGAKNWAFLPLENCSLSQLVDMDDVKGIMVGTEMEFEVLGLGFRKQMNTYLQSSGGSAIITDTEIDSQYVLSLKELQKKIAWEQIEQAMEGGKEPISTVTVLSMEPYGATVVTQDGVKGLILERDLGAQAGDFSIVGDTIEVVLKESRPEMMDVENPRTPYEFPLIFSYVAMEARALAAELNEGDVVDAEVVGVSLIGIQVAVKNVVSEIRKVNITNNPENIPWAVEEYFKVGEKIKVYVQATLAEVGSIRFSLRMIEKQPLDVLNKRAMVFDQAEETAKARLEMQRAEKEKVESMLGTTMDQDDLQGGDGGSILGGEDDLDF